MAKIKIKFLLVKLCFIENYLLTGQTMIGIIVL
jgi:hypothetical protein